jgi:cyclopropane fatty-acyl-phospholipid synthase-like methyltransferase
VAIRGERFIWSALGRVGGQRFRDRVASQASRYWGSQQDELWESNSHWREALGDQAFEEVGDEHVAIFDRFAKALGAPVDGGTVLEWGCGGGANAVAFAPRADRFIGADISEESLVECEKQVRAVCDTPVETRRIDLAAPERAVDDLDSKCSAFLCLYVIEVTTGPEEVKRILNVAKRALEPGGIALVQMKYHTDDPRTRGRLAARYERNLSLSTTFAIDEFWQLSDECGLTPQLVTLVPETRLDVRYAYYGLVNSEN